MFCKSEIESRFGITEPINGESPNIDKKFVWNPAGLGRQGINFTWLVTDGKHIASGYDGKSKDTIEYLKTAASEIRHTVTDATWTVVCEYTKNGSGFERKVFLYTTETCWKKLYGILEKFLEENGYSRFEDIVDVFLVE